MKGPNIPNMYLEISCNSSTEELSPKRKNRKKRKQFPMAIKRKVLFENGKYGAKLAFSPRGLSAG